MRRMTWTAAIVLIFSLILSACGTKDAESVVKELDKFVSSMESYQGSGTMTLHTGQQPLTYGVEVSYQKPNHYRIKLTNEEKDITQIVLRNEEGVFVLTPKLNKVFRFQSDWPQSQGQVYLFQTLANSIIVDNSRQFTTSEDAYVFDVMANYNSGALARQKIWLDKDDLSPRQVEVSDTNANVMVDVKFDKFSFGPKFDKSVFETEANMKAEAAPSGAGGDEPTLATPEHSGENHGTEHKDDDASAPENSGGGDGEEAAEGDDEAAGTPDDGAAAAPQGEETAAESGQGENTFTALEPLYLPEGVSWQDSSDIEYAGQPGLLTRFNGTYSYSLIQTQPKDVAATLVPGTLVDLGFTIGELTVGEELQTLTWSYQGSQFRLSSANLPEYEMLKVAQSVQGEIGK
ncbi:LolA family protein [Paenibacillus sp. CAU 1782]